MCGRFVQAQPHHELASILDAVLDDTIDFPPARFNIAPSSQVTVLLDKNEQRMLSCATWGLIPSWAKDPSIGQRLSNARVETVWEKPSFREAIRSSRIVVPVDGFFEWSPARQDGPKNSNGKPAKEPHYFSRRDGTTMLLAGIASHWRDPIDPSSQRSTVCLLTTVANETMEPIHHRMPVIVEEIDVDQWLTADNNDAKEELQRLFAPAGNDVIQQRVVNISVNNARNEGKHLLDQVDETPTTLF